MPIIAFGFIGVEMVSVTAFEARDLRSLRIPSRIIAYFAVLLYFMCAIGQFLNVGWTCQKLPPVQGVPNIPDAATNATEIKIAGCINPPQRTMAITLIAARGYGHAPGIFNAFMIFSCLSAANSSLYVASRNLYGLTRTVNPWKWFSMLKKLGSVWHQSGVPMWALLVSFLSFIWLPFLQLKEGNTFDGNQMKKGGAVGDVSKMTICWRTIDAILASGNHAYHGQRMLSFGLGFPMPRIHPLPYMVRGLLFISRKALLKYLYSGFENIRAKSRSYIPNIIDGRTPVRHLLSSPAYSLLLLG